MDITFADPKDVPEVTPDNCANSSDITFDYVYSTTSLNANSGTSDAPETMLSSRSIWFALSMAGAVMWAML